MAGCVCVCVCVCVWGGGGVGGARNTCIIQSLTCIKQAPEG